MSIGWFITLIFDALIFMWLTIGIYYLTRPNTKKTLTSRVATVIMLFAWCADVAMMTLIVAREVFHAL